MNKVLIFSRDQRRVELVGQSCQLLGVDMHHPNDVADLLMAFDESRIGCVVLDLTHGSAIALSEVQMVLEVMGELGGPTAVTLGGGCSEAAEVALLGAVAAVDSDAGVETLRLAISRALRIDDARRDDRARRRDAAERLELLRPDQRDVLVLLLEGFSNKEVAARLKIGLRTVERHRADIQTRLGAGSLIDVALTLAWLTGRTDLAGVQAAVRKGVRHRRAGERAGFRGGVANAPASAVPLRPVPGDATPAPGREVTTWAYVGPNN